MREPLAEDAPHIATKTDLVQADVPKARGCSSVFSIIGFGCLPGIMIGVVVGAMLGVFAWDLVIQKLAMDPLDGLAVPAGRLNIEDIDSTVDTLAKEYLKSGNNVGLAIAIVRDDESLVRCFGHRDDNGSLPPDGDTLFELASVGKTFTAMLLADMYLSGKLGLNDPLKKHLPPDLAVPSFSGKEITLLHLATQSSGLPSLPPNFQFGDPLNPYKDYTTAKMFSDLAKFQLSRPPGTSYEYSNFGYGLLGEALRQSEDASYEQLVIDRICSPLAMNRTRMTLTDELRLNVATPHDGGKAVAIWEDTTMPGAGSFLSTANDMLRYVKLFIARTPDASNRLVRAASETVIKRRVSDYPARSIGLGWHIESENAHDIIWHNGGAGGSCSYVAFTITPPCGIVVLSNSNNPVDDLGHKILYLLLQSDL